MEVSATRSDFQGFDLTKKRVFDLILLAPILLIAAPLMLLVALAIWIVDRQTHPVPADADRYWRQAV